MNKRKEKGRVLGEFPLDDSLRDEFLGKTPGGGLVTAGPAAPPDGESEKSEGYKVISISLYDEDLEYLEALVSELKRRGHRRVSKSRLVRFALRSVNIDNIAREW